MTKVEVQKIKLEENSALFSGGRGLKKSSLTTDEKEFYMQEALKEAAKALANDEVPIGAVVVLNHQVIGRGHNERENSQNATHHAEMIAIQAACQTTGSWRLADAQLFVTLEPCPMCSGAILQSRIEEVYFGASDPKAGTAGSLMNLLEDSRFNHWCYVENGVSKEKCAKLLTDFFRAIRQRKKQNRQEKAQKD